MECQSQKFIIITTLTLPVNSFLARPQKTQQQTNTHTQIIYKTHYIDETTPPPPPPLLPPTSLHNQGGKDKTRLSGVAM